MVELEFIDIYHKGEEDHIIHDSGKAKISWLKSTVDGNQLTLIEEPSEKSDIKQRFYFDVPSQYCEYYFDKE